MKEDILQETEEQHLRWSGYFMRLKDSRTALQVAEWNPQWRRRRVRPVNTWTGGTVDNTHRIYLKDEE